MLCPVPNEVEEHHILSGGATPKPFLHRTYMTTVNDRITENDPEYTYHT